MPDSLSVLVDRGLISVDPGVWCPLTRPAGPETLLGRQPFVCSPVLLFGVRPSVPPTLPDVGWTEVTGLDRVPMSPEEVGQDTTAKSNQVFAKTVTKTQRTKYLQCT